MNIKNLLKEYQSILKIYFNLNADIIENEGLLKITKSRDQFKVSIGNFVLPPFMGLTTWVSFRIGRKAEIMLMGDLCLFEDEIMAVSTLLLKSNVSLTALHNHF